MLKVLCVVGTRPEAIKMAPVIKELQKHRERIATTVCSTGQHRQMLAQVLDLFAIKPDHDLGLMKPNQTLSQLSADLFTGLDRIIDHVKPDWVLAQGDTTSVMVTGLVSFYRGVRFGHVEAGLRTGNRRHPFPEEINRRVADLLADAYFAPTALSRDVLIREGCPESAIHVTGNTVIDALLQVTEKQYDWSSGPLAHFAGDRAIVLITAHRRESFGEPFRELCNAIRELASSYPQTDFVYPVHLNPNVQEPVRKILSGLANVHLIEPLDYLAFSHLMKRATLILTDSGGIQEEAISFHVPVLVMRETTERPEGVTAGAVKLVGTSKNTIVNEAGRLLKDPAAREQMIVEKNPYGDGLASRRIARVLMEGL